MKAVAALSGLFSPVAPRNWMRFARRLSEGPGWGPPMFLIAVLGTAIPLNIVFARLVNIPGLEPFGFLAWATWCIVAALAMVLTTRRSVSAIGRMGLCGPTRPRWWFEAARVNWNLFTVILIGMIGLVLLTANQQPVLGAAFALMGVTVLITLAMFVVLATVGYAISFVRGRPRVGAACECVHYFYCLLASMTVLTVSVLVWPTRGNEPARSIAVVLGVGGAALLLAGFISIIRRYEEWERRRPSTGAIA